MFGYIRPMQGELKVRELELFKACYCGMCHALGKKYGFTTRFTLNYEFVFLAMLLWGEDSPPVTRRKRCIVSPFCGKRCCERTTAFDKCAGYGVILTWWKLRDTIADEPFIRAIPYRILKSILSGAYKKASREFTGFDSIVKDELKSLDRFEAQAEKSLDGAADKFAQILCAATPEPSPDEISRPMHELLYHLGRWIYIMDACDDYETDVRAGRYNPVAALYPPDGGKLPEDSVQRLKTTLAHSNNLLCSAFELLPENTWTPTVGNMVYLGMPEACGRVFQNNKKRTGPDL